jgi:hypothetical protein
VLVESYVKREGEVKLATIGRMIFVKVRREGRPEPVEKGVTPVGRGCVDIFKCGDLWLMTCWRAKSQLRRGIGT